MKILISILVGAFALPAFAEVGDKYTAFGKVGRVSQNGMLFEIVGATFQLDHDADPLTANITVKAAVDMSMDNASNDISELMSMVVAGARTDKFTLGVVYDPASSGQPVPYCLGKDFIYTIDGDKTCVLVRLKDIVIK